MKKTPAEARLAQHDKIILDLRWEMNESKGQLQSAEEALAYWKSQTDEWRKDLEAHDQKILDAEKAKADFLKSEAGTAASKQLNLKKSISEFVTKEVTQKLGQRANENTEDANKAREAAAFLTEWMNRETSRKEEWDQDQDSDAEGEESEEGDDEFGEPTRNRFDMQDILDVTAKLPTQEHENEEVAGVQRITYTKEQIEDIKRRMTETENKSDVSINKTKVERKDKKDFKVLTTISASSVGARASKDKPKKGTEMSKVPPTKKDIDLTPSEHSAAHGTID